MNSEKENPIVEIRSAEDAAKWVGRKVQLFWQGGGARAIGVFWTIGHESGVPGHACFTSCVGGIELLDGAAHPRPEGDGWVWCETSQAAGACFGPRDLDCPALEFSGINGGSITQSAEGCVFHEYYSGFCVGLSNNPRRGAWIRPVVSEPAKTPEREAADALEIETVNADDAAQAASAYAASLHRELRQARHEAVQADERARWALPDGWTWGLFRERVVAQRRSFVCYVSGGENLTMRDTRDPDREDTWAFAPLAVVEVVIARYRAEHPE